MAVALVGVWLARVGHAIDNWPYAVITLAILAAGPELATLELPHLGRRHEAGDGALEWLGITRPFTPAAVAELDSRLALPETARAAAGHLP
jgi:hypothetical protein